jgi:hypothetical protein
VDDSRVEELVATIERAIVEHGSYVLKNPSLGLVCGVDFELTLKDPWTKEFVEIFASSHDWVAELRNGAIRFYQARSQA